MKKKLMNWWVKIFYSAIGAGAKKKSNNWSKVSASMMNMGISILLCAVIIKLGLRIFGLNHPYSTGIIISLTSLTVYLLGYKIGISPEYLESFEPQKTYKGDKTKNMFNLIFILLCSFLIVPLMVFIMIIL
ncbi:MAG: hypothetical protein ACI85O_002334 [Saprospiraceae bacterium]|jgi:hypothetical protein